MFEGNTTFRVYRRALIMENKWRAQRWGLNGKLIDFGKRKEVETKALVHEMVELVDDVVDELGSRKDVEYLLTMCEQGSSADRQLAIYQQTNDLKDVVDAIIAETMEGVPIYSEEALKQL
jgi:carboxylate-amine ligase